MSLSIYLIILSRLFSDHHLRCGRWIRIKQKGKNIWDGPLNYLLEAEQRHAKTHTSGPYVYIRALNSSGVLYETAEEGRLFHTGIVLGKNEFFRASLLAMYLVYCDS